MLSSIGGCTYLKDLENVVWSSKLQFKIWINSNQWLLTYSSFKFLRMYSMRGCLPWAVAFILRICRIRFCQRLMVFFLFLLHLLFSWGFKGQTLAPKIPLYFPEISTIQQCMVTHEKCSDSFFRWRRWIWWEQEIYDGICSFVFFWNSYNTTMFAQ